MNDPIDPYELHLLRERHRRALRRPWALMFAGGATVCAMFLWESMTRSRSPALNEYVLLLFAVTAIAGAAFVFQVRGKWPAALVLLGSLPHTLGVLAWLGTDGITRLRDLLFLGGFALLPLTALAVLLLPRPESPPVPDSYEIQ
jgi:hypothetical protein